jgi:hypothetical protein
LGRGWTFNHAKTLVQQGDDILYLDGAGRQHLFRAESGEYRSPDGVYAVVHADRDTFTLRQRYGAVLVFNAPHLGGRLTLLDARRRTDFSPCSDYLDLDLLSPAQRLRKCVAPIQLRLPLNQYRSKSEISGFSLAKSWR